MAPPQGCLSWLTGFQSLDSYFVAAKAGTLPSVSWITPSQPDSEHPPASIPAYFRGKPPCVGCTTPPPGV